MTTRRQFVQRFAALPIALSVGAGSAQSQSMRRRSLVGTLRNDPNLRAMEQAISVMRGLPADNPLSWEWIRAMHAQRWGQHGSWMFLPWHRAQLHFFERAVARISGKKDFAVPYWDPRECRYLPDDFLRPGSSLYVSPPNRRSNLQNMDFWFELDSTFPAMLRPK